MKRLEQEVRTKEKLAAVGEMAAQPRARDPQPAGLHQRLGPGAHVRARHLRRPRAAAGASSAGIRAPVRQPSTSSCIRPAPPRLRPAPSTSARSARRRSRCCATAPRWARPTGGVEADEGPLRLPGRPATRSPRSSGTWPATAWRPCPTAGCWRYASAAGRTTCPRHPRRGSRAWPEAAAPDVRALPVAEPPGTGLGLAIVYHIVREHAATSRPQHPRQGTEVTGPPAARSSR